MSAVVSGLRILVRIAAFVAPPLLRAALAIPFLRSGLTKWDGFGSLSPTTQYLFEEMFRLHLFGRTYPFPAPDVLAYIDAVAEIVLPVLLIVGLATRSSAFGLLVMTGVIQLTVPDGWANFHLPWAALAVALMAIGPGVLSLDWLIGRTILTRAGGCTRRESPNSTRRIAPREPTDRGP